MLTRIYVQSEHFSDIKLVEIDDHATIETLKTAVLALLPAGIDPIGLMLLVEDDDAVEAADAHATHVKHLAKEHGIRVHLHRCIHVEVQVRFGAEEVQHKFSPATTVGKVRKWAGHKLGMQPGDIAEHVLQIVGTTDQPDVDIHIGTMTKCPACSVTFDMVPAHRING
jgi:hypothetical protein